MKLLKMLSVVAFISTLLGCASMSIAPAERATLKRVSIEIEDVADKPLVYGPKAGGAFLLAGPLGLAIAQGTSDLPTAYKQLLIQNKIDIAAYLKAEMKGQLAAKGIEVVENATQANAVMSIRYQYGLTGEVFSDNRFPLLVANVKLTKRNGDVIWKNYGASNISQDVQKQVEARPIPDYFNDPKFLDSQIRKVHRIIIAEVIRSL